MLHKNDILRYESGEIVRFMRVLWQTSSGKDVFLIDVVAKKALPVAIEIDELEEDLAKGRCFLHAEDTWQRLVDEAHLSESEIAVRERGWNAVEDVLSQVPKIFFAHMRGPLVRQAMEKHGLTKQTIYRYLTRFWQRGQTKNALLPDYKNSGAPGKVRASNPEIKRGRPRSYGIATGMNVSDAERGIFQLAVKRWYSQGEQWSKKSTYDQMLKDYFIEKKIDPSTNRVVYFADDKAREKGVPTYRQFCYWYDKEQAQQEILIKRIGEKKYAKDMRGILGTSNAEVWGPGARFQIDASIADVYLVSRLDRDKIIGRPVIYVVIDVYSRMIVGMYVGLEGPSWVGAMMALANTTADKVEYCNSFNVQITEEEWPCKNLPAQLLGDRGEIEAKIINTLINNFNVTVENSAPYRADWKGIVEQRFNMLQVEFKPYAPGWVQPDFRERGGADYRLDAILDLDQFTKMFIQCVLYFNNRHELKKYDMDRDQVAAGLLAIPIELWRWGIDRKSGSLREYSHRLVALSLLPTDSATVTEMGIKFKGNYYTSKSAIEDGWFSKARQNVSWKVRVAYDPRDLDVIYLQHKSSNLEYEDCVLTDRSRAVKGLSSWEIEASQVAKLNKSANRKIDQQVAHANLIASIEETVKVAKNMKPDMTGVSAASQTKGIRDNRAQEKLQNRSKESFTAQIQNKQISSVPVSAKVIPLRPVVDEEDLSEPSIQDILKGLGDD